MRTGPSGRHLALPDVMRVATLAFVAILVATVPVRSQQPAAPVMDRDTLIAALERLMTTREPRHFDHDDGELLKAAVDEAMRRGDAEIARLARRASVPILARVTAPLSPTTNLPALSIEMSPVLPLGEPMPVAEFSASVDGGDLLPIGRYTDNSGSVISRALPEPAARPGLHHVRLRAHVTFPRSRHLQPETRDLPEIVYAIYDPADLRVRARLFIDNAVSITADRLDDALPRVPFGVWLADVAARLGGGMARPDGWRATYCDERLADGGVARTRDICAVAMFLVNEGLNGVGEVWVRTGRVELAETEVQWLPVAPVFQAMVLHSAHLDNLAALPSILVQPPETWPLGDIAVAPEDIVVSRRGQDVDVTATIRNFGGADLHNAHVYVTTGTGAGRTAKTAGLRSFVIDIPRGGSTTITATLPLTAAYGVVLIHGRQFTEHSPFGTMAPDPTPEDAVAFRVINPRAAPRDYVSLLRRGCGFECRGF